MNRTRLIQRLTKPINKTGTLLDKAHRVFGGGMLDMSEEAWDLLDPIFTIDYMGDAEYGFGVLPKTIGALARDRNKLVSLQLLIKAKDINPNWERESQYRVQRKKELAEAKKKGEKPKRAKKIKAESDRAVYVLCREEHKEYAEHLIRELAKDKVSGIKGSTFFSTALDPCIELDHKYIGWLELDHGFFFFVDETAWKGTADLLGVESVKKETVSLA